MSTAEVQPTETKKTKKPKKTVDAAAPVEKKPRKAREKVAVPSRKDAPAKYAAHHVARAVKILNQFDRITTSWGVADLGKNFGDAVYSAGQAAAQLLAIPDDFRAPRGRGGRSKHEFTVGMRVKLADSSMERIKSLYPDIGSDCHFMIATTAKPSDKLLPIVCTGLDGSLPSFFVDRASRGELTPYSAE